MPETLGVGTLLKTEIQCSPALSKLWQPLSLSDLFRTIHEASRKFLDSAKQIAA